MNVLFVSFSGRKAPGNCETSLKYMLNVLKEKGADCSLINMNDLNIHPCLGCNYECFDHDSLCPFDDDMQFVYDKMLLSDMLIMAIPTYSAAPPAIYFAWRERSQGVFTNDDQYCRYLDIVKGYIVFGNEGAGGKEVVNILAQESEDLTNFLMIQSHHYNQHSVDGKLVNIPEVQKKLNSFIEVLLRKFDVSGSL